MFRKEDNEKPKKLNTKKIEQTKKNYKEKGITLVSLVVTVIILLILAGITLNIVLGENGLIGRAKNTQELYKKARINEQLEMVKKEWEIKNLNNKAGNLLDYLNNKKSQGDIDEIEDLGDGLYAIKKADSELFMDNGGTAIWDGTSTSESLKGSGTEENPFLIRNCEDFRFLQNAILNKNTDYTYAYYRQVRDIQFNDVSNYNNWGTENSGLQDIFVKGTFYGQYDGEGHSIIGLYFNTNQYTCGLFQYVKEQKDANGNVVSPGTIKNLKIEKSYVKGEHIGTIVGELGDYNGNGGAIENCEVNGIVEGTGLYTGGLSSSMYGNTRIINCTNNAKIIGGSYNAGGIVAIAVNSNQSALISNCTNNGEISGESYIGGIVGQANNNCEITKCENHGEIFGTSRVAGIAGVAQIINNCKNYAKIESIGDDYLYFFGGIVGICNSGREIKECQNLGNIIVHDAGKTSSQIGGVIGMASVYQNSPAIEVENCNNSGNIDATNQNIGGVVGTGAYNESAKDLLKIKNCSNTGKRVSNQTTLPLVGEGYYTIIE